MSVRRWFWLICALGSLALGTPVPQTSTPPTERSWPQWRGPYATGVSKTATPPAEWSDTKNIPFESRGLYAYDMNGTLLWQTDLGDKRMRQQFGEGSTPALFRNRLLVVGITPPVHSSPFPRAHRKGSLATDPRRDRHLGHAARARARRARESLVSVLSVADYMRLTSFVRLRYLRSFVVNSATSAVSGRVRT
jgi:hypothetical protein